MRLQGRHTRTHAFTLIEMIAAMVVLAVAIPPMLFALRQATIDRIDPVRFSQARWLATERLEDVLADWRSATRGYDYIAQANYRDESPVPDHPAFSRSVRITETGPDLRTAGAGCKTVTVAVHWTDSRGRLRTLDVATVVTEWRP